MSNHILIFFDFHCRLCTWFIDFVVQRDEGRSFLYAPLQGETALKKLSSEDLVNGGWSIVLLKKDLVLREIKAMKVIMQKIYPRFSLLFSVMPDVLFQFFYRWIAKKRYDFFGKKHMPYQPKIEYKKFFLP